jgi:hypothetical protein
VVIEVKTITFPAERYSAAFAHHDGLIFTADTAFLFIRYMVIMAIPQKQESGVRIKSIQLSAISAQLSVIRKR